MTSVKENVTQNGDDVPQTPMGLKVLVVVLGLAIIFMLGLIIWKVMMGGAGKDVPVPVVASNLNPYGRPVGSGRPDSPVDVDLTIARPAGSELISTQVGSTEIVLHFRSVSADTIIIVDRFTGNENRLTSPNE